MTIYNRTLERTYYDNGFFNVERDFDHLVRPDEGPITILLGNTGQVVEAKVSRSANLNGTARIFGQAALRNWFQQNYRVGDNVEIEFISPTRLHILQPAGVEPVSKESQTMVGIIMGSDSDWPTMKAAFDICAEFGVAAETAVVSAHRTPQDMAEYARTAHERGLKVIIAGAGGAAHLPGMVAAFTPLPVIGVPVLSEALRGFDSLMSIVQMPPGVPVATVAIGGGRNAGLLAVQILATNDAGLLQKLVRYKEELARQSRDKNRNLPPNQ